MNKKFFLLLVLLSLLFVPLVQAQQKKDKVLEKLQQLPDVEVKKVATLNGYKGSYLLMITQPVDHNKPNGAKFKQRVWLSHLDFNKPMVIITDGYNMPREYKTEIANMLDANQILVEHRFFGVSVPDSMDWKNLNLFQECSDLHHIRQILGRLYKKTWISSGISKGGQTTIAYRFYFPNDAAAWVPYVAPFTFSKEDPRIIDFIENKVGTKKCRKKILNFQKAVLSHKKTFLPKFMEFAQEKSMTFKKVGGYESGFEHGMLEFSFAFWQWGHSCSDIPTDYRHTDSVMAILEKVNPFDFFSDQQIADYKPYFYQALTEMGIYTYDTKPFKNYLKYALHPSFDFTISDIPNWHYSSCTNKIMYQWLENNGNNMIYIYGGEDPWGSCAMKVDNSKVNSLKLVLPSGSHLTRIKSFDKKTQRRVIDSLSKWTGCRFSFRK
jgi:hypothetical protein